MIKKFLNHFKFKVLFLYSLLLYLSFSIILVERLTYILVNDLLSSIRNGFGFTSIAILKIILSYLISEILKYFRKKLKNHISTNS